MLGFDYERRGGNAPGTDGILYARLGRHKTALADYKLVYDAKQTNQPSVPADKVDVASLEDFRVQEQADFGFFIAATYAAETNERGAVNRRISSDAGKHLTLLKIEHLHRLVSLHFLHGITLTELRSLFTHARTVLQVNEWLDSFESRLIERGEVPLNVLLGGLEEEKNDLNATPNIAAVRAKCPALQHFEPDQLIARLKAIESIVGPRWIEVEDDTRDVLMHQSSDQIIGELERNINGLLPE